jgi:F420H(2)-dependent quinone reductase
VSQPARNPRASITVDGATREYVAGEAAGEECEQLFQRAVQMNPGWLRYRDWAGDRQIPVFRLDPLESIDDSDCWGSALP